RQGLRVFGTPPAGDDELASVHTAAYLRFLRELDGRGEGFVDGAQTPAYRGMYFRGALAVGGTVLATRLVTGGPVAHAFNPAGGRPRASPDRRVSPGDPARAVRDRRPRRRSVQSSRAVRRRVHRRRRARPCARTRRLRWRARAPRRRRVRPGDGRSGLDVGTRDDRRFPYARPRWLT